MSRAEGDLNKAKTTMVYAMGRRLVRR